MAFLSHTKCGHDQGRRMPCVLVCDLDVWFLSQQGRPGKGGAGQVSLGLAGSVKAGTGLRA